MKKIAFISMILNAVFVLGFVGKRLYFSHSAPKPQLRSEDAWNVSRNSELQSLPLDSSDIVFVGNSLTEGFPVAEVFHSLHVVNRGISGNETKHILERIEEIAKGRPKKIFLEGGINDLLQGVAEDTTVANMRAIVEKIRMYSPSTAIYIQQVFPTCRSYAGLMPKVRGLNSRLLAFCTTVNIPFILVPLPMLGDVLDSTLSCDGIHLNGEGYALWKKSVDPLVN